MHLIVAEKNIAAQRIAKILAGKEKVKTVKDGSVSTYRFDDIVTIGLRGHVVEVDFEPGYSDWRSKVHPPRSLIDATIIKRPIEKGIVNLIKKLAKKAELVTIATDFDREGELIGKETYDLIREASRDVPVKRAKFSAITEKEITEAFDNPSELDFNLAAAGESRQFIDLLWGASLTRFISIAAKRGGNSILSVGRVQSPTLAMIVDREKEIEAFVPEPYWVLSVNSGKNGEPFEAQHKEGKFTDQARATEAYKRTSAPLTVLDVKEGSRNDRAPGPFDTTSFIVAAARLGLSASQAMRTAEALYMNGLISYPRTDNTVYPASLDLDALLKELLGTVFKRDVTWVEAHRRKEPTRGKKLTTDHPPIHPTGAAQREQLDDTQWKVYELVVRRFLATLSPDARWKTIKYTFDAGKEPYAATGSRLDEEGYRHVYTYSGAKDTILPELTAGENLPVDKKNLEEKETLPLPRYSQSKLIQEMERLSLGTKSTRHDVIGKLFSRRYVDGNPLKPTAVGRAVIETLEGHSIAITRPEMTKTLEEHMEKIKEGVQKKETVITESQAMLREVFDVLEENETAISDEIVGRTDAERVVGPCPVCGNDLSIRSTKKGVQFIGCKSYPECNFHINLPPSQWGSAMREGTVCPTHHLHHVRLIRRGAPPWDIGCPLCSHIKSNIEGLMLMPSVDQNLVDTMHGKFIYTVYDIQQMAPEELTETLGVTTAQAEILIVEASEVLELYRRRAGLKRFVRSIIQPKRGRGYAKVTNAMNEGGIDEVDTLAEQTPEVLMTMHLTADEANELIVTAQAQKNKARLKELGVPAASLKKYMEAGFTTPDVFCAFPPVYLSHMSGLSITTVQKHVASICAGLGKPVPGKVPKKDVDKGRTELLEVSGLGEAALISLYRAGIYNVKTLAECNLADAAAKSGLSKEKMASYKEALQ